MSTVRGEMLNKPTASVSLISISASTALFLHHSPVPFLDCFIECFTFNVLHAGDPDIVEDSVFRALVIVCIPSNYHWSIVLHLGASADGS